MANIISIIVAYLIGSISCAIILAKVSGKADPRSQGSGNAGATNVLRTQGRKSAIIVLIGDFLKGVVAIIIAHILGAGTIATGFAALAAVVGHIFPVYFKFKGGKGVATSLGVIIMLSFWTGIITLAAWIVTAFVTRYASLASLIAAAVAFILMISIGNAHYVFPVFLIAILIFWKHNANIKRLRQGTENKINL
ncbi:MAG: glycerol-3-phosphate 1-O-acyltransferase PlsY [Gammaproteobacteria bacterium]|nr:glycerol-3-phosphate 1-O-acyltransferase PlsY [Gammaproteobacteria bacterium]MCH9743714.1 glycerol-3-phosphate 1-O-acyltransferase PlsY [Gammaproteobacteria bacterium]